MEGPEIAGELYKVFKAWLAKRIVQGASESTPAMGTVATGAGQRVDDDSGTPATAVPTTVESIAIVVTDALTVRNISTFPSHAHQRRHKLQQQKHNNALIYTVSLRWHAEPCVALAILC